MEIYQISFEHIDNKMYAIIYYTDGNCKKFLVKDVYKKRLFELLVDITILDKYK